MKSFRFRLETVLEWRQRQLEAAQNTARVYYAALLKAEEEVAHLDAKRLVVERDLMAQKSIAGQAFASLQHYRTRTNQQMQDRKLNRDRCARMLSEQHRIVAAAQRKLRLLENLRARRSAEHAYLANREIEDLASESFLAKWNARESRHVL